MNVQLQSQAGNIEIWRIDEPTVTAAATSIPAIQLSAGDAVSVNAGGCVQTGGVGKTWKRFVDPSGPNSDRLYHGTIQFPGMANSVRITDLLRTGVPYLVPPGVTGPIQVGYEDDDYSDNGYWEHDDGTEDQCKGVGNAWVTLTIVRSIVGAAVRIVSVEDTQSTQFFSVNGQGSGLAPDNSIPMISGKPTIIRVYLDSTPAAPSTIDGTLTIVSGEGAGTYRSLNGPIMHVRFTPSNGTQMQLRWMQSGRNSITIHWCRRRQYRAMAKSQLVETTDTLKDTNSPQAPKSGISTRMRECSLPQLFS